MQDDHVSGPPGEDPDLRGRRRRGGGRARRGGRADGGGPDARESFAPADDVRGEDPGADPVGESAPDQGRRSPLPRHQLLHPTPIPGRLKDEADDGIDSILSELKHAPAPVGEQADAPHRERRPREERAGRGRGERPRRGAEPARSAAPGAAPAPAPQGEADDDFGAGLTQREPVRAAIPATRQAPPAVQPAALAPATDTSDDDFGSGLFDPPATPLPAPVPEPAAPQPEPVAPPPPPAPPAEPDDGFGSGLL
jgi:hypothetical protein